MTHLQSEPRGTRDVTQTITFEQPLNERIRIFLRIEQLVQRFEYCLGGQTRWDTHCALTTLLEIAELAARGDIKSELMKELKRQTSNLEALEEMPGVDKGSLHAVIDGHRRLIDRLHGLSGHPGGQLKGNEFLNSIKQRTVIPGGTCDFDLPAYHHWLAQPVEVRHGHFETWMRPFKQINEAAAMILDLIRQSSRPERVRAVTGFYQQNLDADQPYQLIRITLSAGAPQFPEISAGKHRFSVRFLEQNDLATRASQAQGDIDFSLACCAL
jgi:cell division protein ZapD